MLFQKVFNRCLDEITCWLLLLYQRFVGKPLLISAEKYGRIGNRLYLASHLVAWSRKVGVELLNLGVHDYEDLFEGTYQDGLCRYPEPAMPLPMSKGFKALAFQSVERIAIRLLRQSSRRFQSIDLLPEAPRIGAPDFKLSLVAKPVTFIRGFIYDNSLPDIAEEHPAIKRYFRPRKNYLPDITQPIQELRKVSDVVLGIVIRHGDFKTWRGGEFYFETADYVRLMDRAVEYLAPRKVSFFIASDEIQPPEDFQQHLHFFRAGHPIENLGALALCDGMLAAHSSFTGWSQYYGTVPTFHIARDLDHSQLYQVLDSAVAKAKAA